MPSDTVTGNRKRKNRRKKSGQEGLFGYPVENERVLENDVGHRKFLEYVRQRNAKTEGDEHEQRLRILAESIPHIVWTADPDGFQDYFNKRWFEYTGLSTEDTFAGKTALHPDDFGVYVRRWTEALRTGKAYEAEYRFLRASDGTYRWHLVRGLPLRDSEGKIVKWFGTFTDIHDKKLAEEEIQRLNEELENRVAERTEELEETNKELQREIQRRQLMEERDHANLERLKTIIDIMPTGAVIADEHHSVLYINERFTQMFNLPQKPDYWVGKPGAQLFILATDQCMDADAARKRLKRIVGSKEPSMGQEVHLKDGRVLMRDYLPVNVGALQRGHLFLYRDVTKEKRIDAAKSEFMSLASHQLRTPLTSIRWALGRFLRTVKMPEQETQLLEVAKDAAVNMSETIDTMLSIARIEAEEVQIRVRQVDLCGFMREMEEDFRHVVAHKKHTIVFQGCDSLEIKTDKKLLKEIFRNLIMNAVKYTPDGGRIILRTTKKKNSAMMEVCDNGYGIPKYQQDKVFSKFFRGDNVIQKVTEGTGLGLYLTSLLMRLLHGKIGMQSEEGKGTTFTVELPLVFPK